MESHSASIYREKSDDLFREWKESFGSVEYKARRKTVIQAIDHRNSIFVRDGVVCPEQWFSQRVRPLFLLKEAYGGNADWDLIEDHLLLSHQASKMWQRISLWTKGLISSTQDYVVPFTDDDPATKHYGNKYLKQLAVINIKKSGGEKSSDMNTIRTYAEFDKERLKKQFELCDPTVIICGYTASTLDIIIGEKVRNARNDNLSYKITLNNHDVLVLDYWHPANQYPDIMNYYGIMSIYQLALCSGIVAK